MLRFAALRSPTPAQARQLCSLYRGQGWWDPCDVGELLRMVRGSHCFLVALQGSEIIGMARAISDGASDAYIQDVLVKPGFRNRGIGRGMVRELVRRVERDGLDWIGLIAEPGSRRLYASLGFAPMRGSVPMVRRRS
ncbi:MAG: GNAT family N-acetyltransferase [Elusimicrobiota bacterium]